jgi:branched-chain amino acid transport system substrate-binding protein
VQRSVLFIIMGLLMVAACTPRVPVSRPSPPASVPKTLAPPLSSETSVRPLTPTIPASDTFIAAAQQPFLPSLPASGKSFKVALLLPLTGREAVVGQSLQDAAHLALSESGLRNITLLPLDTQASPVRAAEMAERAVANGVDLVLGPLFAPEARAVDNALANNSVPILTFSNDRTLVDNAPGENLFVLGLMPQDQIARLVQYSIAQGRNRFAVLAPDTPFGTLMLEAAQAAIGAYGGQLVVMARSNTDIVSMTKAVDKLATFAPLAEGSLTGGEFQALILPFPGREAAQAVALFNAKGLAPNGVKFMGLATWESLKGTGARELTGAWYSAAPVHNRQAFEESYIKVYGKPPIRQASLAYDAVALAVAVLKNETGAMPSPAYLRNPNGYAGVDGIFRFTDRGIAQRGLAIFEITPSGGQEIDPAPERFSERFRGAW